MTRLENVHPLRWCRKETRTFSTSLKSLLRTWPAPAGVTDAAMESTRVYRRPVYAVLEPGFRLLPVNARHLKHVPGRKKDVRNWYGYQSDSMKG